MRDRPVFSNEVVTEVFAARLGGLGIIDSCSDADEILAKFRTPEDSMRFRLTYDGELKASSQGNTRAAEKWDIRRHLHSQLEELWTLHPTLLGGALAYSARPAAGVSLSPVEAQREALSSPIQVGGKDFRPLVRSDLKLRCSLDILFLRKEWPGSLVNAGGDLDNRLKTLFDGLRMPLADEMRAAPSDLESPFCCLLQDDALITDISVKTDRLLSRPGSSASEVRLVLDVLVSPAQMITRNSGFLGN